MPVSHISPNRIFWARSNRAWTTFDTESHDWRVGGQRKSALNSHWLSTWLRHMNVLHTPWKPPFSSAFKNNSYSVLLNCSELIMPSYQEQRNKWCTFLCIRSAKYHQTDVGVDVATDAICEMHQLALLPLKCKVSCSLHKGYVCNRLKAEMWCLKAKAGMN